MTLEALLVIAIEAAALAVAAVAAARRGDTLARIRAVLHVEPGADTVRVVRTVAERAARSDERMERARMDLAQLLELLDTAVIRVDDGMVVQLMNPAARALLGRRADSMIGRTFMEAFADHRLESIVTTARERGSAAGEITLHEAARPTVTVRATRSLHGGAWIAIEDVSELRRLQRIRAEFIDNLSHELRTPLTNIRLLAEVLMRETETGSMERRVADSIHKIDVESGHLAQMVNELLDLSRIEQGSAAFHIGPVDLGAVVNASVERIRTFAERQGVTLATDVPAGLPAVRADEERIGQLLLNLLHNAVKFSSAGDGVTVSVRPDGDTVVVAIADHGVGIPRGEQERIFERFYKVDKARVRGRGGTGLGLAIARHIAQGHGGRIWVESEEGRGSTFRVALPVGGPRPADGAPDAAPGGIDVARDTAPDAAPDVPSGATA